MILKDEVDVYCVYCLGPKEFLDLEGLVGNFQFGYDWILGNVFRDFKLIIQNLSLWIKISDG